jgi:hypothetical protein
MRPVIFRFFYETGLSVGNDLLSGRLEGDIFNRWFTQKEGDGAQVQRIGRRAGEVRHWSTFRFSAEPIKIIRFKTSPDQLFS